MLATKKNRFLEVNEVSDVTDYDTRSFTFLFCILMHFLPSFLFLFTLPVSRKILLFKIVLSFLNLLKYFVKLRICKTYLKIWAINATE